MRRSRRGEFFARFEVVGHDDREVFARMRIRGWLRIELTAQEQRIVQSEPELHQDPVVRRRLFVL